MKIIALNGSPRKNWNTASLLNKALEGAASQGAQTEVIHLYDLNYKGCISCFSCRLKGGKSYGKCVVKDDLAPVFEKIKELDALILGSPIYCGAPTGEMKSFLERLLYSSYDAENSTTLFKKRIKAGFIYTMGVTEQQMKELGYQQQFDAIEMSMKMIFGEFTSLIVTDTCQYDDYSKYANPPTIDPTKKAKRHTDVFPEDLQKAFVMGQKFAQQG